MTDSEVLKKAIEVAKENGWESTWILPNKGYENCVLFDHSFAKAFWPEQGSSLSIPRWQIHLQEMVLYENPLDYIREFI